MQLNQVLDWMQGPRAEQAARLVALLLGVWLLYRMAVLVWQVVPEPELADAHDHDCCRYRRSSIC